MATLIKADGMIKEIKPENGTDFQLEELQKYVHGYIEIIDLRNGEILVVNDDGKDRYETNKAATQLAHDNRAIFGWDWIDGDVVHCKSEEVK